MSMPAGTYYVGDLCYVIPDDNWDEVCDAMFPNGPFSTDLCGEGTLSTGVKFCWATTKYGDGTYDDNRGNQYGVDAGMIGAVLLSDIDKDEAQRLADSKSAAIIEIHHPFDIENDSTGLIRIGHVVIDTGDEDDDIDQDDYFDEM